jgi:hypothetical protein
MKQEIILRYYSMTPNLTYGYQYDYVNHIVYRRIINFPRLLRVDSAGHFTKLRCAAIMGLDKLAFKVGLINCHPLANLFEFLANYPRW